MSSAFFVLQSNKDKFRIVTVTIPTFKLADSHDFDSIKLDWDVLHNELIPGILLQPGEKLTTAKIIKFLKASQEDQSPDYDVTTTDLHSDEDIASSDGETSAEKYPLLVPQNADIDSGSLSNIDISRQDSASLLSTLEHKLNDLYTATKSLIEGAPEKNATPEMIEEQRKRKQKALIFWNMYICIARLCSFDLFIVLWIGSNVLLLWALAHIKDFAALAVRKAIHNKLGRYFKGISKDKGKEEPKIKGKKSLEKSVSMEFDEAKLKGRKGIEKSVSMEFDEGKLKGRKGIEKSVSMEFDEGKLKGRNKGIEKSVSMEFDEAKLKGWNKGIEKSSSMELDANKPKERKDLLEDTKFKGKIGLQRALSMDFEDFAKRKAKRNEKGQSQLIRKEATPSDLHT
ncbi:MAG: hypothetical protein SGCHY_000794 [Lobulomycetales sp.]